MPKKHVIGVDLGGTNLRVALVSEDGKVLRKIKEPSSGDVMDSLRRAVNDLEGEGKAVGVGIGVAGLIDRENLTVTNSPNLPSVVGRSFAELGLDVPVVVENDACAAALGERWMGAGRGIKNFVLFTLGTGIGGGIVHNGRLLRVASEVGHMSVASGGEKCPCGNWGCLENYASARAVTDALIKALEGGADSMLRDRGNFYKISAEDVCKAAFDGDALSREVLKEAGKHLGVGIANLINLMSPDAVILAGGLTGAWDIFVEEAVKEASKRALRGLFEGVKILPSALGDEAGVLGAAKLALNEGKSAV